MWWSSFALYRRFKIINTDVERETLGGNLYVVFLVLL